MHAILAWGMRMWNRSSRFLTLVKKEFHKPPGTLPWINYSKNDEGWDETAYFHGLDWNDILVEDFNSHPYCFSFIHREAFPFLWGAMMFVLADSGVWQCRALENFLVMWDEVELSGILLESDPAIKSRKRVTLELVAVLNKVQIDIIEEFFSLRYSFGVSHDKREAESFILDLRSS
jgi:hypothetical protein